MDSYLFQAARQHFTPTTKSDGRVSAQPEFQQITKQMWNSYNLFRRSRVACAGNILRLWRQWAHFQRASRTMHQQAKRTKRTLMSCTSLKMLQPEMTFIRSIHRPKGLRPGNPTSRSHFRGADGQILNPQEQVTELQQQSRTKFCKDPPLTLTHRLQASPEIIVHNIFQELSTLPMRKAVPPGVAPAAMWCMGAELAALIIAEFLERHWAPGATGDVPHNLKDAYLAWLCETR